MKHWLVLLSATVGASAGPSHVPTPAATVAAPRIIMFHGGVLEGRRYMTTFDENLRFIGAVAESATTRGEAIAGRPFIEVALYWHSPTWERYANDTALLKTLRPESAQPARFYLGGRENSPLFDYYSAGAGAGLRTVTTTGVEILKRHNVPVYVEREGR